MNIKKSALWTAVCVLAIQVAVIGTTIYGMVKAFTVSVIIGVLVLVVPPLGFINGVGNLCGVDIAAEALAEIRN